MIIAVTYEKGLVFQHFGKSPFFKIYEVKGNDVVSSKVIDVNGQGHGALAYLLQDHKVEVLLCGGLGGGAIDMLTSLGIKVVSGVTGNTDEAVKKYLNHELDESLGSTCDHHHEEGHEEGCHCHEHEHEHEHECCGHHDHEDEHHCHCHDDK